jgi:hypothetical protein
MEGPALEILKSLSLLLVQTVENRRVSLAESNVKDLLLDIEMNDLVDILRVYSVIGK